MQNTLGLLFSFLVSTMPNDVPISYYKQNISFILGYYNYSQVGKDDGYFTSMGAVTPGINYTGQYHFGLSNVGSFFIGPDLSIYGGALRYSSKVAGGNDGGVFVADIRILGGYGFKLAEGHRLDIMTGGAYRFASHSSEDKITDTGHRGLNHANHLGYIPLGIGYTYNNGEVMFGLFGEYDIFLRALQLQYRRTTGVVYGSVDGSFSRVSHYEPNNPKKYNQTKGYGFRTRMIAVYKNWLVEPFFNYWDVAASDAVENAVACYTANPTERTPCIGNPLVGDGSLEQKQNISEIEPANKTIETGVRIGYVF